jgi:hypothetical protein
MRRKPPRQKDRAGRDAAVLASAAQASCGKDNGTSRISHRPTSLRSRASARCVPRCRRAAMSLLCHVRERSYAYILAVPAPGPALELPASATMDETTWVSPRSQREGEGRT